MLVLLLAQVESIAVIQVCVLFRFYSFKWKVLNFLLESPPRCPIDQHWQVKVTFCLNEPGGGGEDKESICLNILTCCSGLMTCGMTKTRISKQIQGWGWRWRTILSWRSQGQLEPKHKFQVNSFSQPTIAGSQLPLPCHFHGDFNQLLMTLHLEKEEELRKEDGGKDRNRSRVRNGAFTVN